MNQSETIAIALQAAESAVLLESAAQVSRAAKAWRRCAALGLDTEFVRERTYHANLGLVQISDGRTVWLLDPMVPGAKAPLRELLKNDSVEKIFHSPSEDLEVLLHAVGALPQPLIDTQLACAMLGQPLQMGYHKAVDWLFDVAIDKEHTRSNWCARPLSADQLRYAALDVCLLPLMWQVLRSRLEACGRLGWLEEDCARQLDRARNPKSPAALWQRLRGAGRLDGASLAILQAMVQWREHQAQRSNRPRGFIIPDPVLLRIADRKLTRPSDLAQVEGLHPRALARYGDRLCAIAADALATGDHMEPLDTLNGAQRKLVKSLQELVRVAADALGIEPALLVPRRELEDLVLQGPQDPPERLTGWRGETIARQLLQTLKDAGPA